MKPSAQSSSSSLFSVVSLDQQQQQRPSTSSQPLSDYSSHVQESFRAFKLTRNSDADESESLNDMLQQEYTHPHDHDDDLNENEEISLNNMVDSDDGYTTPTEDAARRLPSLVSENQWIYTTPQRPRGELVCPGAPKRKKSNSNLYDDLLDSRPSYARSLPTDSVLFGPRRGITKPRKHRKTSPSSSHARRNSFPNIRLDFGENETNHEQGQTSSF